MASDRFVAEAQPIRVLLGEKTLLLLPRRFSTGSCGWFVNGPSSVDELPVQVTISVVVKHSKGWNGVDPLRKPETSGQKTTATGSPPEGPPSPPEDEVTPQALFRLPEAPEVTGDAPEGTPKKKRKPRKAS